VNGVGLASKLVFTALVRAHLFASSFATPRGYKDGGRPLASFPVAKKKERHREVDL
jgi:hypothetical protein